MQKLKNPLILSWKQKWWQQLRISIEAGPYVVRGAKASVDNVSYLTLQIGNHQLIGLRLTMKQKPLSCFGTKKDVQTCWGKERRGTIGLLEVYLSCIWDKKLVQFEIVSEIYIQKEVDSQAYGQNPHAVGQTVQKQAHE